jgi:thiol-disulfide isomerase/thioredoxin
MHKQACASAERYLTSNPDADSKFMAQTVMMTSCNELGEGHMLSMVIASIKPNSPIQAVSLASSTAYLYAHTIAKTEGLQAALEALDKVEALVPFDAMTGQQDKPRADSARATLATTRAELLADAGKNADAIKALDDAIAKIGDASPMARSLKGAKTRIGMMNTAAPSLNTERSHGTFAGLESLKGKVVILDFFAHWCGPCIASFPDMKQMYSDLKGKGLEIIGITTYYGYYKTENREKRDMPKDAEFAKMADFIAEHGLPWPVVYGDRTNFEAYGVTGIPHVTVLDRDGKIEKIKIGYSKATFEAFRAEIEKMLGK